MDGVDDIDMDSVNNDKDMNLEIREGSQLDEQTEREIIQKLEENMPSELEIRMQIMYVTNFYPPP